MNDEDFLLDEDEGLDDGFIVPVDEDEEEGGDSSSLDDEEPLSGRTPKIKASDYDGKLTPKEIEMSSYYTLIKESDRKNDQQNFSMGSGANFPANVVDAVRALVSADPINTSQQTIHSVVAAVFNLQGHNRIPASIYTPDRALRGADMGDEYGNTDDGGFNDEFSKEARAQIADFIDYLASRDLSKDATVSKKRKKRQLPAFIIFLFSSGMYDLIVDCPTMPPEYDKQIKHAFARIQQKKYDVVEKLAEKYEDAGRDAVAERVRKLGLKWFDLEPGQITSRAQFADLHLRYDPDVLIYRSVRSEFMNASKSLTQEVISDMIEVVMDEKSGIYEKLKDKTRSDAIADVKQVYREWCKDNAGNSELAEKIIWKNV